MHSTDKYSEHGSLVWSIWPYIQVFVYELIVSGFESSCSQLTFRYQASFQKGHPRQSGEAICLLWIKP